MREGELEVFTVLAGEADGNERGDLNGNLDLADGNGRGDLNGNLDLANGGWMGGVHNSARDGLQSNTGFFELLLALVGLQ